MTVKATKEIEMNIPGFTAETSVYKTNGYYRAMAGTPNALEDGRGVLPQLPIGFCQANCDMINDPFLREVCEIQCIERLGDGGSGGGGVHYCHPTCGPCHPDALSPSGYSMTCRYYDCTTEKVDCG